MERQVIFFWLVGLFIFCFFKRENTENFKQNKCRQITAFRRERDYNNQKTIYFKLLAFLLGSGGVRKNTIITISQDKCRIG